MFPSDEIDNNLPLQTVINNLLINKYKLSNIAVKLDFDMKKALIVCLFFVGAAQATDDTPRDEKNNVCPSLANSTSLQQPQAENAAQAQSKKISLTFGDNSAGITHQLDPKHVAALSSTVLSHPSEILGITTSQRSQMFKDLTALNNWSDKNLGDEGTKEGEDIAQRLLTYCLGTYVTPDALATLKNHIPDKAELETFQKALQEISVFVPPLALASPFYNRFLCVVERVSLASQMAQRRQA